MALAENADVPSSIVFGARINPASADKVLAASGHTFQEILALADAGKALPHFPLNIRFRATETLKQSQVESPTNTAGSSPERRQASVTRSGSGFVCSASRAVVCSSTRSRARSRSK